MYKKPVIKKKLINLTDTIFEFLVDSVPNQSQSIFIRECIENSKEFKAWKRDKELSEEFGDI